MTYQPPPPAPSRRRRIWPWLLGGAAAIVLVVAIVAPHQTGTATASSAGPVTTTGVPASSTPAAPEGISDGTHEVGTDIAPGKYKTTGPDPSSIIPSCYWARLKNTDGSFDSIITNGNTRGPATLTVKASDAAVELTGGCVWTKAS
ncbi:hypothetical protein [Pseudonocardia sp. D17]|uniref:hypothetical protein n=1 Tax=Pseudonocardia sp. D17 TaxID=882661 RepID=UPI002B367404|nr:hypothetical protein PSD17_55140 [Pseudonocardia sp. D17]